MTDFKRYGWTCSETNLDTLPKDTPEEIKGLAKWLTLEGRRSSLEEWLGRVDTDGRIHGKFWGIGAWTHRMSHSAPNQANIPSVFHGTPETPVEEVKATYDGTLRECWKVPSGSYLVVKDADYIQLRILCHYMRDPKARTAILSGDSALKTDIHSMNQKSLGPVCKTRDDAKTFIYAWILGAAIPKIASILGCDQGAAKVAVTQFLQAYPGLKTLKGRTIPRDARRGYFTGLDGRRVPCDSEHLMLAGYLQNGEAVVMKRAFRKWMNTARQTGIKFKVVDFVHDEWQVEVNDTYENAVLLGELQCKALEEVGQELNLFCPLAGSTKIGKNWKDTH